MSLLFDANLAPSLVRKLAAAFPNSQHVLTIGLDAKDREIWDYALEQDLAIVSKDNDFESMALLLGPPGKAIFLRIGNCSTEVVAELLLSEQTQIKLFLANPQETLLALP
jgi:predicted nuclease of predicted toxin-antitoxin system